MAGKVRFIVIFFLKSFCNLKVKRIFVYKIGVEVMTTDERKLLDTFETQVRHLIYLHDEAKREINELKLLLNEKESELLIMQARSQELETNYNNLKSATAISLNGGDVRETKQRLSQLVREIDKCIALLNE